MKIQIGITIPISHWTFLIGVYDTKMYLYVLVMYFYLIGLITFEVIVSSLWWHKRSSARNKLEISLLAFKNVLTYLRINDSEEKY